MDKQMYSTYIHIIYLYSKYLQHGYVWGEMELFRTGAKCWEWGNDPIHMELVDSRCSFFWGGALVLGIIRGVFQICSTWYRHIMYINVLELCVCYH